MLGILRMIDDRQSYFLALDRRRVIDPAGALAPDILRAFQAIGVGEHSAALFFEFIGEAQTEGTFFSVAHLERDTAVGGDRDLCVNQIVRSRAAEAEDLAQ